MGCLLHCYQPVFALSHWNNPLNLVAFIWIICKILFTDFEQQEREFQVILISTDLKILLNNLSLGGEVAIEVAQVVQFPTTDLGGGPGRPLIDLLRGLNTYTHTHTTVFALLWYLGTLKDNRSS